jgi:citrate synthase
MTARQQIHTRIWQEEAELDDAFATRAASCHGYDVYGDMLGRAGWADMLYLLFRGEAPTPVQAALLEDLALVLANPGPRDPSVHAAMCAGTGGSTAAASLMAALAVGAGRQGGARDVLLAMQRWQRCGTDLACWAAEFAQRPPAVAGLWPDDAPSAGFEPHTRRMTRITDQVLARLAGHGVGAALPWLAAHATVLATHAGAPVALSGVTAAALTDLGFTAEQGELLTLLLRLPGAAAHALEQRALGPRHFPFFEIDLLNDPQAQATP